MPNYKPVVHFLLVDFGGVSCCCCQAQPQVNSKSIQFNFNNWGWVSFISIWSRNPQPTPHTLAGKVSIETGKESNQNRNQFFCVQLNHLPSVFYFRVGGHFTWKCVQMFLLRIKNRAECCKGTGLHGGTPHILCWKGEQLGWGHRTTLVKSKGCRQNKQTLYLKTLSKLRLTPLPPTVFLTNLFLTQCCSCWPPSLSLNFWQKSWNFRLWNLHSPLSISLSEGQGYRQKDWVTSYKIECYYLWQNVLWPPPYPTFVRKLFLFNFLKWGWPSSLQFGQCV